ncbi:MAG: M48 family metallopeptidase [Patescibacteria group bacterium]|jgi:hypothetical protein
MEIKRSKQVKRMRITVYPTGRCVVTVPYRIGNWRIKLFIATHQAWIKQKIAQQTSRPLPLLHSGNQADYLKHKAVARKLVQDRLTFFNQYYHFTYKKIAIRNQHTRWGSCSRHGNLNFNYRLIKLPTELADYIIVHELCHVPEMNHGKNFWQLVAKTIPDYKQRKKLLYLTPGFNPGVRLA